MKKYSVKITCTAYQGIKANSKEEAEQKILEEVAKGNFPFIGDSKNFASLCNIEAEEDENAEITVK